MDKNKDKANILIKKNLKEFLKTMQIKRINSEGLIYIESFIKEQIIILAERAKQQMIIQGKRTLDKEVLNKIF